MSNTSTVGDSSTAEPQALNLLILVRIQVPQILSQKRLYGAFFLAWQSANTIFDVDEFADVENVPP